MERLTRRITDNVIELSAKANPINYNGSPQRVHIKHPFWNVFNRLCDYEDAEEQGLLLRLPCKVGDTVYVIMIVEFKFGKIKYQVYEAKVFRYHIDSFRLCVEMMLVENMQVIELNANTFGVEVFLTREEAEAALEKMKGE